MQEAEPLLEERGSPMRKSVVVPAPADLYPSTRAGAGGAAEGRHQDDISHVCRVALPFHATRDRMLVHLQTFTPATWAFLARAEMQSMSAYG